MNSSVFLPFDDVLDDLTRNGKKIKKEDYLVEGIYPIIDQGAGQIAGYSNESDGLYQDVPALIFGDHTRIIKYVDTPFFLGADGVKLLRSKISEINYRYLYYFLIANPVKNTGYNRHYKWLKELLIPVRSVEEQCKIVDMLDILTDMLRLRTQQLADLDLLIKSRFVEMFGGGDYPKAAISDLVAGKVSSAKRKFVQDDTIKYIDISAIDNQRNIMTGYTEYVFAEAPSRAQQHIIQGDILISTVRPNLKNVAMTTYSDDNLVASSGFCVLRASRCLSSYLMAIVCSDEFTEAMSRVVTGANYPAIKDSDVLSYIVSVPPMDKQRQFEEFTIQVDKSKFAIQQSITELETLKQALMQKYFGPQQTSAT